MKGVVLSGYYQTLYRAFLTLLIVASTQAFAQVEPDNKGTVAEPPFMETYPALTDYLYKEPASGFFLGLGLSPLGVLKDRTMFSGDFFQLHFRSERWDILAFNASYGVTRAQIATYQSNNFVFMTAAKIRIGQIFSVGPLVGYEYVNFPNLNATLVKVPYQTPRESFSTRGVIYGVIISQTFQYKSYLLQVSEVGYQQTYSNVKTSEGWTYIYDNAAVRSNPSLIAPCFVSMLKLSLLF